MALIFGERVGNIRTVIARHHEQIWTVEQQERHVNTHGY